MLKMVLEHNADVNLKSVSPMLLINLIINDGLNIPEKERPKNKRNHNFVYVSFTLYLILQVFLILEVGYAFNHIL